MSNIFTKIHNFCTDNVSANTRSNSIFYNAHNPRTRNFGLNTLRHLGLQVYDMVPEEIKNSSVQIFKSKIKNWVPPQCPCRLCAEFVSNRLSSCQLLCFFLFFKKCSVFSVFLFEVSVFFVHDVLFSFFLLDLHMHGSGMYRCTTRP